MIRWTAVALIAAAALAAAQIRLYLTDGTYHVVREYQVQPDRVTFYSVERSQWEEIPLDLVDLKRTEAEYGDQQAERRKELQIWEAEEAADRARRREAASVPGDAGVYLVEGGEILPLARADLDLKTDRKKEILKIVTPVPIAAGRRTVLLKGARSEREVSSPQPEFYIRLNSEERFGIIRLTPKEEFRIVEKWDVMPVTNQVIEQHEAIGIFRREVGDNLYKLWPKQPLEPGEYAVVEFSPGEANIQIWDFGYRPEDASAPPAK